MTVLRPLALLLALALAACATPAKTDAKPDLDPLEANRARTAPGQSRPLAPVFGE